jgi:hypothetical protein
MSESYRQQVGQPAFTDAHANGSLSGPDPFDVLGTTNEYNEHAYRQGQSCFPLEMLAQEAFPPDHLFAYASHSRDVSLPGKRTISSIKLSFLQMVT